MQLRSVEGRVQNVRSYRFVKKARNADASNRIESGWKNVSRWLLFVVLGVSD